MTYKTWTEHFEQTKNKPPRSLLVKALPFVAKKTDAIDLGSGALNDSKYLLEQGFEHVTAMDKELVAKQIADQLPKERFSYVLGDFETYNFPRGKFDLVNAQYAIPFVKPGMFEVVFQRINDSLRKEGILVGQLFGNGDEWENNKNMNFHILEEVKKILSPFEILYFEEEEKDKPTAAGKMKHWHIFHFIVRK